MASDTTRNRRGDRPYHLDASPAPSAGESSDNATYRARHDSNNSTDGAALLGSPISSHRHDHDTAISRPNPSPSPRGPWATRPRPALNGQAASAAENLSQVASEKHDDAWIPPREGRNWAGGQLHHRGYGGNNRRGGNGGGWGPHYRGRPQPNGDRWNHNWNPQPVPLQRPPLARGPIDAPPHFIRPVPFQPFGLSMAYNEMGQVLYLPLMPLPPPPPLPPGTFRAPSYGSDNAMQIYALNEQVRGTLLEQIEYYFSPDNLCKDIFLRSRMDGEGWVSIHLIASFNRVREITSSIQFIFDTVCSSTKLEVQGDKIRKKGDWRNWLIHAPESVIRSDLQVGSLAVNFGTMAIGEGVASSIPNSSSTARTHEASNRSHILDH